MNANTAAAVSVSVARNDRNFGIYEVHKAGCAHLALRHMEVTVPVDTTDDVEAYARDFAEGQDGILSTLGPCLKRGKREVYGNVDY